MYKNLFLLVSAILCLINASAQKSSALTLTDLLKSFYNLSTLPAYEQGSFSAQTSSYDRTGYNDDGFGGTYSFVRRNPDSSLVLFDVKGAGVVNRIWTPTPSDDSLDFYIDDSATAAFTIRYRDLFTGKVYPFVAPLCANQLGGFYCYLPIPFSKFCRIVLRGKKALFYQIGYRLYPKGSAVKKFSLPLKEEEKQSLETIRTKWSQKPSLKMLYSSELKEFKQIATIRPGQTKTIYQSVQPGRIAGFELLTATELGKTARDIDIRITWDNETGPAVYCPLSDYFGYAFGKASMQGLLAGSDGKRHYSFFPMPFDRSAKIELIYRQPKDSSVFDKIDLQVMVYTSPKKRDATSEGKFYAHWNRSNPVPKGSPFTMLDIKGRGHFAGTVLQAQGLITGITSFFEGDDSTVVDGEMRMHGTGSEDFFNGGWYALLDCWDAAMSLPLSGALEYSIPLCRTGGYRFFVGDKVSFEKSFFQTIEHGPELNRVPSDYSSVSYYYCSQPNPQTISPSTANTRIYMPDTLEVYPHLLPLTLGNGLNYATEWGAFGSPATTQHFTVNNETVIRYSLKDIPVGNYDVILDYIKYPEAGSFSIWQRQTQISEWIDGYSEKEKERSPQNKICELALTAMNNSFSFRFKTKGKQNQFSITRIILVRKK